MVAEIGKVAVAFVAALNIYVVASSVDAMKAAISDVPSVTTEDEFSTGFIKVMADVFDLLVAAVVV